MDRLRQIESLFHAALERPPGERDAWLQEACGTDLTLLAEVRSLVANHSDDKPENWAAAAATQLMAGPSALTRGVRLGVYEILEPIGAGGMGVVYRALDTTLKRKVAIKVLPDVFAHDSDRLARFSREARILASLNHPNIAAIYGVEEGALVMELVEGHTLDQIIASQRLSVEQALSIARQIAEAVEYAHEKGVVHRDLKPANVKLTPDGKIKVLDFGLAKALSNGPAHSDSVSALNLSTRTPGVGIILGTPAYMSPEQARGAGTDRRCDVWAFGAILYEALTGKRAFAESTPPETFAAVLKTDPEWNALPANVPAPIRRLLRRCLERDSRGRLRDIGDAILEIDEALALPVAENEPAKELSSWRTALPWAVAVVSVAIACLAFAFWLRAPAAERRPVMRWTANLPHAARNSNVVLSPDGTRLYIGLSGAHVQVYIRDTDQREAKSLTNNENVDFLGHFFSPDSRWIVYRSSGALKKVPTVGGDPITLLARVPAFNAGVWGPDDTIILGNSSGGGLARLPASGGKLESLTAPDPKKDETLHDWPYLLPGGKVLLYNAKMRGPWEQARIEALILRTGERRTLIEGGTSPRYAESGHLIYTRSGTVFATPFDPERLQIKGPSVPVMEGLDSTLGSGIIPYCFSRFGDLVYMRRPLPAQDRTLIWIGRNGAAEALPLPQRSYSNPSISPDANRIAFNIAAESQFRFDVWVYDIRRQTLERRTVDASNLASVWTPDGERIAFRRIESGENSIYWMPADGSGSPERLLTAPVPVVPGSWADSKTLIYYQGLPLTANTWTLRLQAGDPANLWKPGPLIEKATHPQLSPDGRWIAYVSVESGDEQVYVQPYPGPGARIQISMDGGRSPRWARSGRELFYRTRNRMMAVDVQTQPRPRFGVPKVLFTGAFAGVERGLQAGIGYDVSPDGKRFLMVKSEDEQDLQDRSDNPAAGRQIEVVHNWFEELRRFAPAWK